MNSLSIGLSILLALVFLAAGSVKFLKFGLWQYSLRTLLDSPRNRIPEIAAWAVPCVELLIGLLLLAPQFRLLGTFGALVTLTGFTLVTVIRKHYAKADSCNCFGNVLRTRTQRSFLVRNLALIAASCLILLLAII